MISPKKDILLPGGEPATQAGKDNAAVMAAGQIVSALAGSETDFVDVYERSRAWAEENPDDMTVNRKTNLAVLRVAANMQTEAASIIERFNLDRQQAENGNGEAGA